MNFRQKIILSLLLYIVLCSATFAQVVDIPDPNLRAVIREHLNFPDEIPITRQEMLRLEVLKAGGDRGITDLTGLEYAANLRNLSLWGNQLANLTPIAGLSKLRHLDLGVCGIIVDIGPLANLIQLNTLNLAYNRIVDISPLANLTHLTVLVLHSNRVVDVNPLAGLTELIRLRLHRNNIEDVSPLANLTNLEHLELQNNRITDVTPLANLTGLEYLDTQNNPIFDPDSPRVDIPDSNLRAVIRETLELPHEIPITRQGMLRLEVLEAGGDLGITNLTGLEYAANLRSLALWWNQLADLTPIANLKRLSNLAIDSCGVSDITPLSALVNLTRLDARQNNIVDISPLANLTNLVKLQLNINRITDITSLSNLTNLEYLELQDNFITDVTPLANLTRLEFLEIQSNKIWDRSSLDNLPLAHFVYDESCELSPLPVRDRIEERDYPSVFTPWGDIGLIRDFNRPELSDIEIYAGYDLWFSTSTHFFGLGLVQTPDGFTLAGVLDKAIRQRDEYLALNPNMLFIVDIRMRSYALREFPEDWPYWIRDSDGNIVNAWAGIFGLIDFTHPDIQERIVQQAIAVSKCGLYDGIHFDWWNDKGAILADLYGDWSHKFRGVEAEQRARDNILRRIRAETRPDFLIMGNVNRGKPLRTGRHLNGGFMETLIPRRGGSMEIEDGLAEIESTLLWLEQNMREPHINALEGWSVPIEPPDSPTNLRWMRAFTTLSLTHSDGYIVFNDGSGHAHYWYDFWDADLGAPLGAKPSSTMKKSPAFTSANTPTVGRSITIAARRK